MVNITSPQVWIILVSSGNVGLHIAVIKKDNNDYYQSISSTMEPYQGLIQALEF